MVGVDYTKLSKAVKYYKELGYKYIDVPWHASIYAQRITFPKGKVVETSHGYSLVGSAEQSYLDLILKGKLPHEGKFVTCTPCFRDEDVNELHKPYFMKVELIHFNKYCTDLDLAKVIADCYSFYADYLNDLSIVHLPNNTFDIMYGDIELGSYGIRSHPEIGTWLYATGCAEPRLSIAMNL